MSVAKLNSSYSKETFRRFLFITTQNPSSLYNLPEKSINAQKTIEELPYLAKHSESMWEPLRGGRVSKSSLSMMSAMPRGQEVIV